MHMHMITYWHLSKSLSIFGLHASWSYKVCWGHCKPMYHFTGGHLGNCMLFINDKNISSYGNGTVHCSAHGVASRLHLGYLQILYHPLLNPIRSFQTLQWTKAILQLSCWLIGVNLPWVKLPWALVEANLCMRDILTLHLVTSSCIILEQTSLGFFTQLIVPFVPLDLISTSIFLLFSFLFPFSSCSSVHNQLHEFWSPMLYHVIRG